MKKLLFIFLVLSFAFTSYASQEIKVVTSIYEPFVYYKDDKLVGFDIELLEKICERNGFRYTIEVVPFSEIIEKVSKGEADIGIGAIYVTDERRQKVNFTKPYLKTGLVFVTNVNFKGDLKDLSGKKIGVKKNATGEKIALELSKKFKNLDVIRFNSTEESLIALVNQQVDVVINDYINTNILMVVKDFRGKIYMPKGILGVPKLITEDYIAFPVNKQKQELLGKFNRTIEMLEEEGIINELIKHWPEIKPYPNIGVIITINVLVFIFIFLIIIGFFKYLKDRHVYKTALENEKKMKSVLDSSPNAIILSKATGEILFLNERFFEIFGNGYTNTNNIFDFYNLTITGYEEIKTVKKFYYELFDRKDKRELINQHLIDKDGKIRHCVIQASFIGKFDSIDLFFTIIRDETYTKELEEKFYQAQKLESIGRLAGGIAHDFNNFLTTINGFAFLSLMNIENKQVLEKNLKNIIDVSEKAAKITRQLLAFSRKDISNPVVHNINQNIKDMEKVIEKVLGEEIEVRITLDENIWNVKIDPVHVDQILINLITNAKDAMPKGGVLKIETKNVYLDSIYIKNHPNVIEGEYVLLMIEDNGMGMSEEVKAHLFEPFFTTKEKGRGTGLGLATVYGIVKQNNGYIWYYSEFGKGTVFKIYLPRCTQECKETTEKPVLQHTKGTGKIVVAEDDSMIREFIEKTLSQYGYKVLTAENGLQALDIVLNNEDVDLILTDIVMPKMSGLKLVEKVKQMKPNIKILMMSGYSEELLIEKESYKEGYPLLLKPFSAIKLIETIKQLS
jgi:PAS domain S-box-containing protein